MKAPTSIEQVPIEDLIPYATNARTHSDDQVGQIVASIREFGWTNPVLIDSEGTIVAGHGRVLAARRMGIKQVPCIRLGHLTQTQARAYVIADNKLALNAGWDEELLSAELRALAETGFDIGLTGFEPAELKKLLEDLSADPGSSNDDEATIDRAEEAQAKWGVKLGDLWKL